MKPTPFSRRASLVPSSIHPRKNSCWLVLLISIAFVSEALGLGQPRCVETLQSEGGFPVVEGALAASIYVEARDHAGVVRAARDLQADVRRVTGLTPVVLRDGARISGNIIIVGTLGKSALLSQLIQDRKIDAGAVRGQ